MSDYATPPVTHAAPAPTRIQRLTTMNWVGYTAFSLVTLLMVVVAVVLIAAATIRPTEANPEPPVSVGAFMVFVAVGVVAGALGWVMSVVSIVTYVMRLATNLWAGITALAVATPILAVVGYFGLFITSVGT